MSEPERAGMAAVEERSILWVTNMAPPYRRSVWATLGTDTRLRVVLLESDESLAREARRGEDWQTSTLGDELKYSIGHAPTVVTRRGEAAYYFLASSAKELVSGQSAVLLGGWESPAYWQLARAARRSGARVVGFYESTLLSSRWKSGPIAAARAAFFRKLDGVVVPGVAARDAVLAMGVSSEKVHLGFNAVDVERFSAMSSEAPPSTPHCFGYVGQLIPRKNLRELLRAFASVPGDCRLTIVGSGPDLAELTELARALGVMGRVEFTGYVRGEDLPAILSHVHTLVLPSLEEVWGLVVNEALAAGRHVVVSDRSGVAPSVRSMKGVFVSGTDATSLALNMAASRDSWSGPIGDPEIADFTPERFALTFKNALLK